MAEPTSEKLDALVASLPAWARLALVVVRQYGLGAAVFMWIGYVAVFGMPIKHPESATIQTVDERVQKIEKAVSSHETDARRNAADLERLVKDLLEVSGYACIGTGRIAKDPVVIAQCERLIRGR